LDRIGQRNKLYIITVYYEFSVGDESPITIGRWLVEIGSAKKQGKLGNVKNHGLIRSYGLIRI